MSGPARRRRATMDPPHPPLAHAPAELPGLRIDACTLWLPPPAPGLAPSNRPARPPDPIEALAADLAARIRALLAEPGWRATQRILVAVGGGAPMLADAAVGLASARLRAEGIDTPVIPLRHPPEEAGLVGAARLLPPALLEGCDLVATAELDPGGLRAGLVLPRLGVRPDLAAAGLWRMHSWTLTPAEASRAALIGRLAGMLADLEGEAAAAGLAVAPTVGIGFAGLIGPEGRIAAVAEGMPGDWQEEGFGLAAALARLLPGPAAARPEVLLHNATVARALSEAPFQRGIARWGVLATGPSPGQARFTNLPLRG